ncbi:diacylglycerol kinase family protein [Qipengyuania spongiae]|uniref:Acylglycerol kinase family protein n=1 Tax=Qipengyuania spongiae TaxID=2909673 RepID=A0ABY5T0S4_9SPHN|nr:diacylglycerol kinase family protein [Qipengyuania spongiae]UVI40010.1 acylglycerol kinase family protein [Qipengyuania spongiae]
MLVNSASGSNTPEALDSLSNCLSQHSLEVERTIRFPDDDLPTPSDLDSAGVQLLVIYTGDGTLNAAIAALDGWGGAVLVLPGGTMNLLSKRLHGDRENEEIIETVAGGGGRRVRPIMACCEAGTALAGLLVGPGTRWGSVREAMREFDIAGMASGAAEAMAEMTGDAMVCAADPALGSQEGYPLIEMTPGEHGIQLDAFYADTPGDFAAQGWAILRRSFREGPHKRLGVVEQITIESADGSPLELLIDGEPEKLGPSGVFTMAACGVDLLATGNAD